MDYNKKRIEFYHLWITRILFLISFLSIAVLVQDILSSYGIIKVGLPNLEVFEYFYLGNLLFPIFSAYLIVYRKKYKIFAWTLIIVFFIVIRELARAFV